MDLKAFPFFATLPTNEVLKLAQAARIQKYTSGTRVVEEGEEVRDILLVISGQVAVTKQHDGKKKTLFNIDPGDTYGEVELLNGTPALATLVGYQEFQLMFIPKELVLRLVGMYPGFASEIRQMYARRASELLARGLSKSPFGRVITFFNVKGGAGKSVMSANLAVMMARYFHQKTVLVDLNLAFGDQHILLNLTHEKNILDLVKNRPPWDIKLVEKYLTEHASGLKVLLPPPLPELADKISPDQVEKVLEILRAHYDYVIIDTHNQMTDLELRILEFTDMILLMMTMELTFIKNTKILLDLFGRLKIPREKVKVILNRAFKSMGLEPSRVEGSLRYAISHFIPSAGEVVIPSVNNGQPFVLQNLEGTPIFIAMEKIARLISGEEPDKGTWNMFSMIREVFGF